VSVATDPTFTFFNDIHLDKGANYVKKTNPVKGSFWQHARRLVIKQSAHENSKEISASIN
jgi:hypothetical protein